MASNVRLSAAPIDWGVAALVPGNPNPDELLDHVAHVGYTGCELGTHGYFGWTAEEILGRFRPRGLAVTASWYDVVLSEPLTPEAAADIDLICAFLQAAGATVLNISAKILPERVAVVARVKHHPETWWTDEQWAQVPHTLMQVHDVTSKRGVTVAFHPHVGTHVETGDETRRLLDCTADTPIKLCLDTGHLMLGGSDPIALLAREGHRLVHIHAKDVDGPTLARVQAGELDYFAGTGQGLYCDLGHGVVNWHGLARGLDACDFDGWVVAEQDRLLVPGSRIPFDANARNHTFLASLFALS